jgi:hypothetical protein
LKVWWFSVAERWTLVLSNEVREWYLRLAEHDKAQAARIFTMLEERGPMLRMPHSRALGQDLFELRFNCEQVARRITYTFDVDRRVITLTTFRKQRDNESREVRRARAVLKRHRASDEKRR